MYPGMYPMGMVPMMQPGKRKLTFVFCIVHLRNSIWYSTLQTSVTNVRVDLHAANRVPSRRQ